MFGVCGLFYMATWVLGYVFRLRGSVIVLFKLPALLGMMLCVDLYMWFRVWCLTLRVLILRGS